MFKVILCLVLLALATPTCTSEPTCGTVPVGKTCEKDCDRWYKGKKVGTCIVDPADPTQYIFDWNTKPCIVLAPTNLKYHPNDMALAVDIPYTNTPSVDGVITRCRNKPITEASVPKPFPEGITLDRETGIISGTAKAEFEKTVYTIECMNSNAGTETVISISVGTNKTNHTVAWVIVACVVVIVIFVGVCLFFRIRGTGRASIGKKKNLKQKKNTTRV